MALTSTVVANLFVILCASSLGLSKEISVNGIPHKEHVLINGINRPYQLSYYKKNNTDHDQMLYFSYNVGLKNESHFEIGYSENDYPVPVPVEEVKNGFATAINHKDGYIYFGGSEGVYIHSLSAPTMKNHIHLLIPDHDIWDLFYKDSLYFINFPSRHLYKHHSGNHSERQTHIHEKIYNFVIDGEGDTFFNNKSGLYMITKDSKHRIHIKGAKVFRAFEVSRKGVAHFCGQNEVYVADKKDHKLQEVAKIKNIFGLTFDDDDNMIFSDPHQIVRLKVDGK